MAIDNITASITRITGAAPATQTIYDAQRFVVASIPKDLMWGYSKATAGVTSNPVTDNDTLTNTDSVLSVKRGNYIATKASDKMRGFLDTTNLTGVLTNVPSAGVLIVFTKAAHGLVTGNNVTLSVFTAVSGGATQPFFDGLTSQVTRIDADSFTLEGVVMPSSNAPVASTGTVSTGSGSLFAPSSRFPKFVVDDANEILVYPAPSAGNEGKVVYVSHSNVDDNSDLVNAVIYHAASAEFTKLAKDKITDWVSLAPPSQLSVPSFGSDLSLTSVAPIPPANPDFSSISDITFTTNSMLAAVEGTAGTSSASSGADIQSNQTDWDDMLDGLTAPSYSKPVLSLTAFPTLSWTTPSSPVTPSLATSDVDTPTALIDYVAPVFAIPVIADISSLQLPIPPTPVGESMDFSALNSSAYTANMTISGSGAYSQPGLVTTNRGSSIDTTGFNLQNMVAAVSATPPVFVAPPVPDINAELGISGNLGDDMEDWVDDENPEMIEARGVIIDKKISLYEKQLQAAQASYEADSENFRARLTTASDWIGALSAKTTTSVSNPQSSGGTSKTQTGLAGVMSSAVTAGVQKDIGEKSAYIQKYTAEVDAYQKEATMVIQQWINEEWNQNFLKFQAEYTNGVAKYSADISNQLNIFNKGHAQFQADLQLNIQKATLLSQDDAQILQQYASDIQSHQADVAKIVTVNQGQVTEWQQENALGLQQYQMDIQNSLNDFTASNTEYASEVQAKIAWYQALATKSSSSSTTAKPFTAQITGSAGPSAQVNIAEEQLKFQRELQDYTLRLQKYSAEIGSYQQSLQSEVQEFATNLQKNVQEYQSNIAKYGADIQNHQSQGAEQAQKIASAGQNAAFFDREADKHYKWATEEVMRFVQLNQKTINQQVAASMTASAQPQYRR